MSRNERIRISFLVHDVSRLGRTALDHRLRPLDVTRSQWWVLNGLSSKGNDGITQTELARLLDIGKVALGGIVDRLEHRGLVRRRSDGLDGRINRVFLTRKGTGVLNRVGKIGLSLDAQVMRGISIAHREILSAILNAMKSNLIALDAVPGSKRQPRD
jgi:DNA-binding MarR family transcriptional regulator